VEAAAVMRARKGPGGEMALDALLERADLEVVPMTLPADALAAPGDDGDGPFAAHDDLRTPR